MDENYFRIAELMDLYLNGEISQEEMHELYAWKVKYPFIRDWLEGKEEKKAEIRKRVEQYKSIDLSTDWENVLSKVKNNKKHPKRWIWTAAAASVAVILSFTFWLNRDSINNSTNDLVKVDDSDMIMPGGNLAYLTLSNGQKVSLGNTQNGFVQVGNNKLKVIDHVLDYTGNHSKDIKYQTLKVPRGGTFQLRLEDGTKVWLNAESEIEFPTSFAANERLVHVKGEVYFEVAKDVHRPFRVGVENTVVEALGTSFNINTHLKKGLVKTILTEGKIMVTTGKDSKIVEPGYAAYSGNNEIDVKKADIEEALAWKDGYFYFNGKKMNEILDEVARWYKVDLDINATLGPATYKGGIKRTENIQAVCRILEYLTGYHLQVEGRTLIVDKAE